MERTELIDAGAMDPDDPSDPRNDPELLDGLPSVQPLPDLCPQAVTPTRLGRAAKRLVLRIDAAAAAERDKQAKAERKVWVANRPDGMASFIGDLAAADAQACWKSLDHHARGMQADGDPRTLNQLMADTMVGRLTGVATVPAGPLPPDEPRSRCW